MNSQRMSHNSITPHRLTALRHPLSIHLNTADYKIPFIAESPRWVYEIPTCRDSLGTPFLAESPCWVYEIPTCRDSLGTLRKFIIYNLQFKINPFWWLFISIIILISLISDSECIIFIFILLFSSCCNYNKFVFLQTFKLILYLFFNFPFNFQYLIVLFFVLSVTSLCPFVTFFNFLFLL